MAQLDAVLARFPKTRPPLPAEIAAIYARQYAENRAGGSTAASAAQRLERWMHRKVADGAAAQHATLELGAGNLNQLPFEPEGQTYDIVEPFTDLYRAAPALARVRRAYADIGEVPAEARYDRIISIAVMEHIDDLPLTLARAAQRLSPGGVFKAAIPSEGGLLWRLGWTLTTGLEFRLRHGLDYGKLMAHEHVNTAAEIERLIRALFAEVRVEALGIGRQFSLYRYVEARAPRMDIVADWTRRFS